MDKNKKGIPRRKLFPLMVGGLLAPYLGFGKTKDPVTKPEEDASDDAFQTLLKPDGTVVRVRKQALSDARVVEKKLSNTSLRAWLKKKDI